VHPVDPIGGEDLSEINRFGSVEIIAGCMYSGKTEELIRRLRRAQIARLHVEIFKPTLDNRYSSNEIVSHNHERIPSKLVETSGEILHLAKQADVVGIDEAQFFDHGIVDVAETLASQKKRVIIAGLDLDFRGRPFGPMPYLLCIADYVTKTLAVCMKSGLPASRTQRIVSSEKLIEIGHTDKYEARHRAYFSPP
jgi:thymidine kinase